MTYGERLRELRAERRLSLREVEERGGPNKDTMSLIERGVHKPYPQTLGRIAEAFGMSVAELRAELEATERPLAEAPPSPEQPPLNGFNGLEEERRPQWDAAVRNARQVRERGRTRMKELLAAWRESKEREELASARRKCLDEMGELLQEAYDAEAAFWRTSSRGLTAAQLPDVQAASRFYGELCGMIEGARLHIRRETAQEGETAQQGQSEMHSVEERAA